VSESSRINRIAKLFDLYKPRNLEEILEIGTILDSMGWEKRKGIVNLTFIGQGSYRKVYKISDLPLVVKLPIGEDGTFDDNIAHTYNEMDAIKRVTRYKKYDKIRKYLPKIYYYNKTHGVILMHEYPQSGQKTRKNCQEAGWEISQALKKPLDLYKNFSVSKDGKITLIDWGVLGKDSDWCQF